MLFNGMTRENGQVKSQRVSFWPWELCFSYTRLRPMLSKKELSSSRMSDTEAYDSDKDSLSSMEAYDGVDTVESQDDIAKVNNVRTAVQSWKTREFGKTTNTTANPKGLTLLNQYRATAARLYYDILNYLQTSKNNEQNMKDTLYVNIVMAIGAPASLSNPLRILLTNLLEKDLLELPYTMEPKMVNTYAKDGVVAQQEFPEEE
jgi:hypothetical protein